MALKVQNVAETKLCNLLEMFICMYMYIYTGQLHFTMCHIFAQYR